MKDILDAVDSDNTVHVIQGLGEDTNRSVLLVNGINENRDVSDDVLRPTGHGRKYWLPGPDIKQVWSTVTLCGSSAFGQRYRSMRKGTKAQLQLEAYACCTACIYICEQSLVVLIVSLFTTFSPGVH